MEYGIEAFKSIIYLCVSIKTVKDSFYKILMWYAEKAMRLLAKTGVLLMYCESYNSKQDRFKLIYKIVNS